MVDRPNELNFPGEYRPLREDANWLGAAWVVPFGHLPARASAETLGFCAVSVLLCGRVTRMDRKTFEQLILSLTTTIRGWKTRVND